MRKSNELNISKEKKEEMIASIIRYFNNEREEELGTLAASMILDFFIEELAPEFYNQGVNEAYKYMSDRIEDLFSIQITQR